MMSPQREVPTMYWQAIVARNLVVLQQGRNVAFVWQHGCRSDRAQRQCTGKQMRISPFPLPLFEMCLREGRSSHPAAARRHALTLRCEQRPSSCRRAPGAQPRWESHIRRYAGDTRQAVCELLEHPYVGTEKKKHKLNYLPRKQKGGVEKLESFQFKQSESGEECRCFWAWVLGVNLIFLGGGLKPRRNKAEKVAGKIRCAICGQVSYLLKFARPEQETQSKSALHNLGINIKNAHIKNGSGPQQKDLRAQIVYVGGLFSFIFQENNPHKKEKIRVGSWLGIFGVFFMFMCFVLSWFLCVAGAWWWRRK